MGRVRKAVGGRVAGTNEGSAGLIQQTHSQEPQAAVDHSSVFWLTRSENSCRARVHVTRNHTRQPHIPNTDYSIQHYLTYKHLHVLERKRKFLQRKTHLKFTLFCGFSWKLTLKTWLCRLLTLACQCFLSVISWQAGSQCRGKCEKTAMVHRYIWFDWLLKQTVSHVRTWNKAQASAFCQYSHR